MSSTSTRTRAARRLAEAVAVLAVLAASGPARAHHGVAAVGLSGTEGPGAALETTSALPLAEGTAFVLAKGEYVPFRRFRSAAPENKTYSLFGNLALGVGVRPWLSAYVFQPYSVKEQDGVGRNEGLGDPSLLLALAFKYDRGLRLVPEKESVDDLADWHFAGFASSTIPVGPTDAVDRAGAPFAPDMQTGFGGPSVVGGLAATKQLADDLTLLADASYQHFFAHDYRSTRYRFGGETRADAALAWRAFAARGARVDLVGELNGLHVRRDRERDEAGRMEDLRASGGAILYAGGGVRASYAGVSLAAGVRRAALTRLNERADQQGSEGLERLRATLSLSWSAGL